MSKSLEEKLQENYYKKSIRVGRLEVVYDLYELFDTLQPIDDFMSVLKEYILTSRNERIQCLRESSQRIKLSVSDVFHLIDLYHNETWYYDVDSDIDYFNQIVSKYMIDGGYFSYYMDMILRCQDIPNLRAEIMKYVLLNWEYIITVYHLDIIYEFGLLYGRTSLKNSRIEEDALRRGILNRIVRFRAEVDFNSLEKTVFKNLTNEMIDVSTRNDFFCNKEWGEQESSRFVEAGAIAGDADCFDVDLPINRKTIEAVVWHKDFAKVNYALSKSELIELFVKFASDRLDCRKGYLREICEHFFEIIMRWSTVDQGFVGLLDDGKAVKTLQDIVDEVEDEKRLLFVEELSVGEGWQAEMMRLLSREQDKVLLNSSLVRLYVRKFLKFGELDFWGKCFGAGERRYRDGILALLERNRIVRRGADNSMVLNVPLMEFKKKIEAQRPYCFDFVRPVEWSRYLRMINYARYSRKDEQVRRVVDFAIERGEIDFATMQLYSGKGHGYVAGLMVWLVNNGVIEDGEYTNARKVLVGSMEEFDEVVEKKEILQEALKIAFRAHKGQVDKSGAPYILHPLAVASRVGDEDLKIIALLHDVLEDSGMTPEDLLLRGIPEEAVEVVKILTKPKDVEYEEYLKGVKQNTKAMAVKMADLAHNTAESRAGGLDEARRKKYEMAKRILEE